MAIHRRGSVWTITSGDLAAEVLPAQGGKIRRLLSGPQGRNLFFADPRPRFPRDARGQYLQHDFSGFDECFPTVGKSAGRFGQDHGLLWDRPWNAEKQGDRLVTWITRPGKLPVQFVRQIWAPRPQQLRQEYTLVNLGRQPLPFLYSSHPILALEPDSRLELPGVKSLTVLGHNGVLKSGKSQPWPVARTIAGKTLRLDTQFTAEKQVAGKWFAPGKGLVKATFPSIRRKLILTWDQKALPALGIWLSLGINLDSKVSDPGSWICAALEPCTSPQDVVAKVPQPCLIFPEKPFVFWIQWELSRY